MRVEGFDEEYVAIMGVPATRVIHKACGEAATFFGIETMKRSEEWSKNHVCGVKVDIGSGFKFPEERRA